MEISMEVSKTTEKTRAELVEEVKRLIFESVQIHHIPLSDLHADTPLFQGGLGLDSVDVLEVVVAVEKKFGVKVKDTKAGQDIFRTIGTVTDFIAQAK